MIRYLVSRGQLRLLWLPLVIVLVTLPVGAACLATPQRTATPTPTPRWVRPPSATPVRAGIGAPEVVDPWEFTIVSAGPRVKTVKGRYREFKANGIYFGVLVRLKNVSIERLRGIGGFGDTFVIVDSLGRRYNTVGFNGDTDELYTSIAGWSKAEGIWGGNYEPGQTRSGILVFDLIEGATGLRLEFRPHFFQGDKVIVVDLGQ